MPEEAKKEEVKEEKTVDIDTSGPDVDVKIPEEKAPEDVEVKEEPKEEVQEPRTTEQEPEVKAEEPKEEPKEEQPKGQPENENKKKKTENTGGGGGTNKPKDQPKAPKNHQNKIDDIKKAHAKLVQHATAFANEKNIHLKGGHAGFKGHFEKYNTAKTVYDNAVRAEKKFKNRSFVKGQDFMKAPKALKLSAADKSYMTERRRLYDLADEDKLYDIHHEDTDSSKYDKNYNNKNKSKDFLKQIISVYCHDDMMIL